MPVRVGINGFGRIGRNVLRAAKARAMRRRSSGSPSTTSPTRARSRTCSKYDSIMGPYPGEVRALDGAIEVDGPS